MKKLAAVAVVCAIITVIAYNIHTTLDPVHAKPFHEKRQMCLTTRTEMGIFHPCSKKEHNLNKPTN